jgi:hypothetical protein
VFSIYLLLKCLHMPSGSACGELGFVSRYSISDAELSVLLVSMLSVV